MNRFRLPTALAVASLAFQAIGCGGSGSDSYQEASVQDAEVAIGMTSDAFDSASESTAVSGSEHLQTGSAGQPESTDSASATDQQASTSDDENAEPVQTPGDDGTTDNPGLSDRAKAALARREAFFNRIKNMSRQDAALAAADNNFQVVPEAARVEKREVKLLIPDKTFRKEEGALRVSFDDIDLLKVLNMEPVPKDAPRHFPAWLKSLNGKRIRLRGFMYPTYRDEGLRGFVLARDNQICCFGKNPREYDLLTVTMREGVTTDYIQNIPFDVVGVLRITDVVAPGEMYMIDDAVVIQR